MVLPVGTDPEWTSCRYGSADEALHDPNDTELYSESVYFNFVADGEDGPVGGIMRIGLRPTDGYAELSLNLPLNDGTALFCYQREPLASGAFAVGGSRWECAGMRLETIEPSRRWRLRYRGDRPRHVREPARLGIDPGDVLRSSVRVPVELELEFEGRFPLHTLSPSGDIAEGGGVAFARNHYEQFGAVSGTIAVGTSVSQVAAGPAFRDHSWGPRDWQAAPDSDFITIVDADGSAIAGFVARLPGAEFGAGVRWGPAGLEPVQTLNVETEYAGEPELRGPLTVNVAVGERRLRYEARVRAFLPLRHRRDDQTVRIGQALLELDGITGTAAGWTDLTRPVR
jgi:hypothetical protein